MWTRGFWLATAERAVKTVAQTAVALVGVGMVGVLDVDWVLVGSVAGLAGVVSVLTSVASSRVSDSSSPSLVDGKR